MSSRTNLQGHVTVPESVVDIRAALGVAHSVASDKRGVARSHGHGVTRSGLPALNPPSSTGPPPGPVMPDTRRSVPTVEPFPGLRTVRSFSQSRAFRVFPRLFGAE